MGLGKGMAQGEKGMALGNRGMAQRHAKRGWGKHYPSFHFFFRCFKKGICQFLAKICAHSTG